MLCSCNAQSTSKGGIKVSKGNSSAVFDYFHYTREDDYYNEDPLTAANQFFNPILPGWYSDPSICSNGEDYFLVTSTLVYYPGVPIFHSKDLVNWTQVGHVLDRPSQLANFQGQGTGGGIFAPAISYNPHNKTYYMITTNVGAGNFFVKTQDLFGSWSEPIHLPEVGGIDPSFFFDEDGRAYIVNNDGMVGKESLADNIGCLTLKCSDIQASEKKTPAFVARRVQHYKFSSVTRICFQLQKDSQKAGMLLFKDEEHQYFLSMKQTEKDYSISLAQISDSLSGFLLREIVVYLIVSLYL
nr:family 43 glycosylhydrolase [Bacteroides sp. 51]